MHIVRVIVIVVMDASGLLHDLTVGQLARYPDGQLVCWLVGFMGMANLIGFGHCHCHNELPPHGLNLISTCLIDLVH